MTFSRLRATVSLAMLLGLVLAASLPAQEALLTELRSEHDPFKRSDKALTFADTLFEQARDFYDKGDVHSGDAQLENMTKALKECVQSLTSANKSRYFKKAELHVATLQRRMQGLVDDLSLNDRGWAEFTQRKMDEIHEELLLGAMKK